MPITIYHGLNDPLAGALAYGLAYGIAGKHKDDAQRARSRAQAYNAYGGIANSVYNVIHDRQVQQEEERRAQRDQAFRMQQQEAEQNWRSQQSASAQAAQQEGYASMRAAQAEQAELDRQNRRAIAEYNDTGRWPRTIQEIAAQGAGAPAVQTASPLGYGEMGPPSPSPTGSVQEAVAEMQQRFQQFQQQAGIEMGWSKRAKAEIAQLNSEFVQVQTTDTLSPTEKVAAINQLAEDLRNVQMTPQQKQPTAQEIVNQRLATVEHPVFGKVPAYLNSKNEPELFDWTKTQEYIEWKAKQDEAANEKERQAELNKMLADVIKGQGDPEVFRAEQQQLAIEQNFIAKQKAIPEQQMEQLGDMLWAMATQGPNSVAAQNGFSLPDELTLREMAHKYIMWSMVTIPPETMSPKQEQRYKAAERLLSIGYRSSIR